MVLKTKIAATAGQADLVITREFDLPVEQLFKAYTEPVFLEQWMGTKVLFLESKINGSYRFETSNPEGMVVFCARGVFHDLIPNHKIIRTFEMENTPFDPQLEFLEFEKLTDETSKLTIHIVYRSVTLRDQMLQLPFAQGLNMAHNRLENIMSKTN